jgi:hypothetical protein
MGRTVWATVAALVVAATLAAEPGRSVILFGDTLGLSGVRLSGPTDSRRVYFSCEAQWDPAPGSELHLFLEHAGEIDGNRAFLSIALNGGILRSLRLDESNRSQTEVIVALPPAMLHRSNELLFRVEQPPSAPGTAVWSLLEPGSYVAIAHGDRASRDSLKDLPLPLLDPHSYRPLDLAILEPFRASGPTLEGLSLIVAGLSSRVAPHAVTLHVEHSLSETGDPLLVVGTPLEQPSLGQLLTGTPFVVRDGRIARGDGKTLDPSTGVAGTLEYGKRAALFVSGSSPSGLARATRSLFVQGSAEATTLFTLDIPEPATSPRDWPNHAPPRTRFLLADLGYKVEDLRLSASSPLSVPVRTTPDAVALGEASAVHLLVNLLPGILQQSDATLSVLWNGVEIESVPHSRLQPPAVSVTARIPNELLRRESTLTLALKTGALDPSSAPLGSLDPSSEFYLPRAYVARLPDLGLLQAAFFPFSLRGDLGDVMVIVPEDLGGDAVALLGELGNILGRYAPSDHPRFRVRTASSASPAERASFHIVLLDTPPGRLIPAPPIDWQRLPNGGALRSLPMVQELPSPWNKSLWALVLRAPSPAALVLGLQRLEEPRVLARLGGDTAFLAPEGPICFTVGTQRTIEEVSYLTLTEAWLQSHWLALPLIVALVGAALFLPVRRALGRHKTFRATSRP